MGRSEGRPFFCLLSFFACIDIKKRYLLPMNSANRQTFGAIFSKPVPKNIHFKAIEALLVALGCKVIEGDGSRVRFVKGDAVLALHRPHPGKEAKPYQVRDVLAFLKTLGATKEGL